MGYKISQVALNDIENIWLYAKNTWPVEQADRYINLILDEIEYLSENPETEKEISNIRENYRKAKVKSHLIFYSFKEGWQHIEIIRILHQQMDVINR